MTTGTEIGAISVRIGADLSDLNASLGQASQSLRGASETMSGDLGLFSGRANGVFSGLANAIANVAVGGRSSMKGMVDGMLSELSRLAVRTFISGPIDSILGSLFNGLSFGGARAGGGPVASGSAYLVGEQGPELFMPSQSGTIIPNGRGGGVTVNIYAQDARSVIQSESQIAAMLARASARGQRNL